MKEQFIADAQAIINLQNIRWVTKSNTSYGTETFQLEVRYNVKTDSLLYVKYKDEKARDEMYDKVSEILRAEKS